MHDDMSQAAARRITEEAAQWLLASREGLDEPSRIAFVNWLRHSPAHVAEYMAIVQWDQDMREAAAHEPMGGTALVAHAAAEPAVVPFRPRSFTPARHTPAQVRKPRRRWPWLAGAAMAAVAVLAVTLVRGPTPDTSPGPGVVYTAPADATRSLQLADGSRIQLNRGSAIRVRFDDRQRAIAVIDGTMLIDVGHASSAPLTVSLGSTVLRDIGTVFQVRAQPDGGEVTVLSGRVDVMAAQSVVAHLQGGERATLARDGSVSHLAPHADITQELAWLPAEIEFHDQPIAEVAQRFNDYGQAPLLIEDAALAQTRISGRFHAREPAGFIAYLETLEGVRVLRDARGIHVGRASFASSLPQKRTTRARL